MNRVTIPATSIALAEEQSNKIYMTAKMRLFST